MALHHKIKPHHHLTIWIFCGFALIIMFTIYSNAKDSLAKQEGPSEKTKQFFGANRNGGGYQNPVECQRAEQEERVSFQAMGSQMEQLQVQVSQKQAQMNGATPEQVTVLQAEMQALQKQALELQNQMKALEGNRNESTAYEPSLACKQAVVNMMKAEMTTFRAMINSNILPTFNKVDAAVSKIEAKIPMLKQTGQDPALIAKIEANIASVKSYEVTLQSFFQYMISKIDTFLGLAASNPDAAFGGMQKEETAQETAASNAADALVTAFEELEALVNQLK